MSPDTENPGTEKYLQNICAWEKKQYCFLAVPYFGVPDPYYVTMVIY
jgi:hypothetical protein